MLWNNLNVNEVNMSGKKYNKEMMMGLYPYKI